MRFTEKIKSLREADGLTQRQLSASLGIDVALYNRFEKGERLMKRELVCKLAEIYGCNRLSRFLVGVILHYKVRNVSFAV